METIAKTDYVAAVKEVLGIIAGPLSVQPLVNNIIYNPKTRRISILTVGEDRNGEDVFEKPIIITFTGEGKICIEKNNTDLDIRKELVKKGVPEEDIVRK